MRKNPIMRPQKRRKGPLPFRYVFLISTLIFCFLTVQGLVIIEKGIRPTLLSIAQTETQRIGTLAINDAISKKILEESGLEGLVVYERDTTGKVTSVDLNAVVYNRVLRETVKRVQDYLNAIERGEIRDYSLPTDVDVDRDGATFSEEGIIHMIPLGQATKNSLLAHLGPKIPVRLSAIGDVKADYSFDLETTGINNTWISVAIDIWVDVKVVIPFATDEALVKTSIPVAMVWVPGDVPDFYSTGGGSTPGVVMPPSQEEVQEMEVPETTEDVEIIVGDR